MEAQTQQKTFFKELVDRRFFQFLGTYLGISFGLLQFAEFLEKRFEFGDNFVERIFVFLIALLPAVVIFIYNHGRKGDDAWTKFEKWFIPTNLFLAFVVSFLFGFDKNSPHDKEVSIVTETGDTISRVVPSIDDSKRITIFPFESVDDDKGNWKELGYAMVFNFDIEQDLHFVGVNPLFLKQDYLHYGRDWLSDLPFAVKLKIAQDNYSEYFLDANYSTLPNDSILLDAKLVDSNSGEVFYESKITSATWVDGIDVLSKGINGSLIHAERPSNDSYIDLPASDLISTNDAAVEAYIKAYEIFIGDISKMDEARLLAEQSITLDKDCAECLSLLANINGMLSRNAEEINLYSQAITKSEVLSERQKMGIRYRFYIASSDYTKARILLNNWMTLYPSDSKPYSYLMTLNTNTFEYDKAIELGELAVENGHRARMLIRLSEMYLKKGDVEKAEEKFKLFENNYPHKAKEYTIAADIELFKGDFEKAIKILNRISLTDPNNLKVKIKLCTTLDKVGKFEESGKNLDDALLTASNGSDSLLVLKEKESHLMRLGKCTAAIDLQNIRYEIRKKMMPAIYADLGMIKYYGRFLLIDREDDFKSKFDEIREKFKTIPWAECVADHVQAFISDDSLAYPEIYDRCVDAMTDMNGPNYGLYMKAMKYNLEGKYSDAAITVESYMDSTGIKLDGMDRQLSGMYRKAKKYDKANQLIDNELEKNPFSASLILEKAKVEKDLGNNKNAESLLKRSLEIWNDADPNYKDFVESRKMLDELASG